MTVVLDAWALVAYMKNEPVAGRVAEVLEADIPIISNVNLGEVVYALTRSHGEKHALDAVRRARPLVEVEFADWPLTLQAASIKARGGLSYADAFAVATATKHDASLYTGDPELIHLEAGIDVVDLREGGA